MANVAQIYECPFVPLKSCLWSGSAEELSLHYQTCHIGSCIVRENAHYCNAVSFNFVPNEREQYEENILILYAKHSFLLQVKADLENKLLWCGVRYIGEPENVKLFRYYVSFSSSGISHQIIRKSARVLGDTSWDFETDSMLNFNFNLAEQELYCINVCGPENPTALFIEELQCAICYARVVPPVYMCEKEHIICKSCRNQSNKCQHSEAEKCSGILRNVSNRVLYPCENVTKGCSVVAPLTVLQNHQRRCLPITWCFAENECQFKGTVWTWWYHLCVKHRELKHHITTLQVYDLKIKTIPFKATHFMLKWSVPFKICCSFTPDRSTFTWTSQQLGLKRGEDENYHLDVCVADVTGCPTEFCQTVRSSSLTHPNEDATHTLEIKYEDLACFITDQKLLVRYAIRE